MASITVFPYNGKTIEVEILDTFESGGIEYAAIQAVNGLPFVGGNHQPVCTAYATVEARQLVTREDKPNLLTLALAREKKQWRTSEIIYIWGDKQRGAYLKNDDCEISLNLTGYRPSLRIFWLDLVRGEWKRTIGLNMRYEEWARKAQEAAK